MACTERISIGWSGMKFSGGFSHVQSYREPVEMPSGRCCLTRWLALQRLRLDISNDRVADNLDNLLEFTYRRYQRRHENDDVADGAKQETAPPCFHGDLMTYTLF